MASLFIFKSLVFSQLLLLVLGSADYEKCPSSFMCGDLGTIKFPFTVSQHPHCGVLAIHGCDDPNPKANKSIQISNAPTGRFRVRIVENSTITITDLTLGTYLRSKRCDAFSYDLTLPPSSPLGTLYMKYNTSLFRCNKSLNLTLPQHYYNYTSCPAYNIVYHALQDFGVPLHPSYHGPRPIPACSKVQFAIRDSPDTDDPFSFLSHEILMEVQLSDDCTKCVDHERGNCQLDGEGKFQCVPGMHRQFGRNSIPVSQYPQSGVLAIHGCHDPNPKANKIIQISNTPTGRFRVEYMEPPYAITIKDEALRHNLQSENYTAFSYNVTLPPSSLLGSVYIKYNTTLFRCNNSLSVIPLPQNFYKYANCSGYDIIHYGPPSVGNHPDLQPLKSLTACSKLQFAIKDEPDTNDPYYFLDDEILMEIQLFDDCKNCIHHKRGQCQLDVRGQFYCVRGILDTRNRAKVENILDSCSGFILLGLS